MDLLLIIVPVVLIVGAVSFGAMYAVARAVAPERRRLQARLAADIRPATDAWGGIHLAARGGEAGRASASGLPLSLDRRPLVRNAQRWLTQGYPNTKLARFLIVQAVAVVTLAAIAGLLSGNLVMALVGGTIGLLGPMFVVNRRRASRKRLFDGQLPEALDFLCRVLRSGQSVSTGLQMMGEELPQPIAGEFRRCYDQHSLGQSIEHALRDLATRANSPDFAFFATAVIIQRQTGGDLAEVLNGISDTVRKRQRLAQSVRAKTAEGRFTGYIMVAFPAIMFVITYFIDPARGDVMLTTPGGHHLIALALFLQAFGLFLIRRITTVRV